MNAVSAVNEVGGIQELSEEQLNEVSGGWVVVAGGVAAIATSLYIGYQFTKAAYDFGYAIGRRL